MKKLWVYNYDFEFELSGVVALKRFFINEDIRYLFDRASSLFLPLSSPSDIIWTFSRPESLLSEHWQSKGLLLPNFFVSHSHIRNSWSVMESILEETNFDNVLQIDEVSPWGWSLNAFQLQERQKNLGISFDRKIKTVYNVNSKIAFADLRNRFLSKNFNLPSRILFRDDYSLEELRKEVEIFFMAHEDIRIKHAFGTSGKEQQRFEGKYDPGKRSLNKWLAWMKEGKGLLLEKNISPVQEWSLHYDLEKDGNLFFQGVTKLFLDKWGSYKGTLISSNNTALREICEKELLPLLQEISRQGYQGPLGIDIIEDEQGRYRFLECNGRWTMGRIALEWGKRFSHFPAGLYWNCFFSSNDQYLLSKIIEKLTLLEKNNDCQIILIAYVRRDETGKSLATFFLQGIDEKKLWRLRDELTAFVQVSKGI